MASGIKTQEGSQDLIALVSQEILAARMATRPTSRQELANIVHERSGMPVSDAFEFVDRYCDEHEPGVPGFLQEEFAIPYLKVLAVFNAIVAIGLCYNGVRAYEAKSPHWWAVVSFGVLFFGFSALSWVKSLEREVERNRKKAKA
jgi:hypothetical protein